LRNLESVYPRFLSFSFFSFLIVLNGIFDSSFDSILGSSGGALGLALAITSVALLVEGDKEDEIGDNDGHAEGVDPPPVVGVTVTRPLIVPQEPSCVEGDDEDELDDLHLGDVFLEPEVAESRDREPIIEIHRNVHQGVERSGAPR